MELFPTTRGGKKEVLKVTCTKVFFFFVFCFFFFLGGGGGSFISFGTILKQHLKSHQPVVLRLKKVTSQLFTGQLSAGQLSAHRYDHTFSFHKQYVQWHSELIAVYEAETWIYQSMRHCHNQVLMCQVLVQGSEQYLV